MKIAVYSLSGCLALLGLLFLIAAGQANLVPRLLIAVICLVAASTLVALIRLRPQTHVHRQELHLSGDVALEQLTCRQCGGQLTDESARVEAGAVFVSCPYCGAQYQLEEAPKW